MRSALAPHLPVEVDGAAASTLDLAGPGFTLLAAPDGEAWCQAATEVASTLNVPLTAHRVAGTGRVIDTTGRFATTFGLAPTGAVLIRPDGVITWRADHPADAPDEQLRHVLSAVLARGW